MRPIQPVSLLLLDINMPDVNGMEALVQIKEKYRFLNERLKQAAATHAEREEEILRPFICYLSQHDKSIMGQFIKDNEKADCYLEKPLPLKELTSLLRLINVL